MKKILIFVFLLAFADCFSQDRVVVDSLLQQLNPKSGNLTDSARADIYYRLSREYWSGSLDTAMMYAGEVLKVSESSDYTKGKGNAFSSMGVIYWFRGDYVNALLFNEKSLREREKVGNKGDIAKSYHNIGLVYDDQGNFPEALRNYIHALQLSEELNDKSGIAQEYNVIGVIHYNQKNYKEALKDFLHSLEIRKELGDKYDLTESYSNLGLVYFEMNDMFNCKKNYNEALRLRKEIDDQQGIAISYNNFGDVYVQEKKYEDALVSYHAANEINVRNGYRKSQSSVLLSLGKTYSYLGNLPEAIRKSQEGISIATELGALDYLSQGYRQLAAYYYASGEFKKAYDYQALFKMADDSLFNSGRVKEMTQMQMQYEFDKKAAVAKAIQEKKDAVAATKLKQQRNIRNIIIAGLAGLLFFTLIVIRQRNRVREEKKRSDELLLNILPEEVAAELKANGRSDAKQFDEVTVLFTDFTDFTLMCEKLSPQELVNEINYCYSAFDAIISKYGIEKIKTIGDAYMCAGGLTVKDCVKAENTVKAALDIRDFMLAEKQRREPERRPFFEIRIGCHTGPVVAGIVGIKKFAYDIWGDTVNIASRMESSGEAGRVNISCSTYELVKDKFNCIHRGKIKAKNKGEIDMYFVEKV